MVFRMRTPSIPGAMNLIVIIILLLLSCGCRNCFATSPDVDGCQNSTNPTLVGVVSHIIGVWNSSKYGASSFRDDIAKIYFQVWPEDMHFQYFCEDGKANLSLTNIFVYGGAVGSAPVLRCWYCGQTPAVLQALVLLANSGEAVVVSDPVRVQRHSKTLCAQVRELWWGSDVYSKYGLVLHK